jgi:hypothetical protein
MHAKGRGALPSTEQQAESNLEINAAMISASRVFPLAGPDQRNSELPMTRHAAAED